jgi:hypothetical protein
VKQNRRQVGGWVYRLVSSTSIATVRVVHYHNGTDKDSAVLKYYATSTGGVTLLRNVSDKSTVDIMYHY